MRNDELSQYAKAEAYSIWETAKLDGHAAGMHQQAIETAKNLLQSNSQATNPQPSSLKVSTKPSTAPIEPNARSFKIENGKHLNHIKSPNDPTSPKSTNSSHTQNTTSKGKTNCYIIQPTTAKSYPNHRNSTHRQSNPSEGKANCYINPATETLAKIQVTQQHRISLVVSKLRVDGEFTG